MPMADDPDRLSQLPDELLQHILQLAPCREAESTAVLSRRWHGLWPPPAVKLDIPSIDSAATATAHGPVSRLSIHVGVEGCESVSVDTAVGDVLSSRAFRGVQDVRIGAGADTPGREARYGDHSLPRWDTVDLRGDYELTFGAVASAAVHLLVLHITDCCDLQPPPSPSPATLFPCLEVLRLRNCCVCLQSLQDMVVASPQLTALQLEYVSLSSPAPAADAWDDGDYSAQDWYSAQTLRCPRVTTLVLLNCSCDYLGDIGIKLDVPRVQHFRYRGKINRFTIGSPLPDVRRAYLHILGDYHSDSDADLCERFWSFLKNFGAAKVLKLKLKWPWPLDSVAVPKRKRFLKLVGETSFNAEHLEIDARYDPATNEDAVVAIGNFLHCCPVIADLRLKLTAESRWRNPRGTRIFLNNKAQLDFHKSVDHFKQRRDRPVIPLCGDDDKAEVVCDIPGLSNKWFHFSCLRLHLKRLSLQFHMDKPDCVGVQLAKFFVERGTALEEIYIDDGNMKLWEHMNCKISGYAASPQALSERHVLARMSHALSMNQFSSSKIGGWFYPCRLEVWRTHPGSAASRSFTILPLADA